jgi:CopG family transcriptional regulator, nickel-responsive regulator
MDRFTISLPAELANAFDRWLTKRQYANRSEAVRDLVRAALEAEFQAEANTFNAIASLTYVYDHHDRTLSERLMEAQHEHHDRVVATTHAHLDHDHCLEVSILRGPAREIESMAHAICGLRGIHHGQLHLIRLDPSTGDLVSPPSYTPLAPATAETSHGHGSAHPHIHPHPHQHPHSHPPAPVTPPEQPATSARPKRTRT